MDQNIEIFETAFVTSHFRASNTALSRDRYAHLWPTQRTIEYHNQYVKQVSTYEPLAHCLRNRYFLDLIESLYAEKCIDLLINFGCGFSMYPFLLPEGLEHIEIDVPISIEFKEQKIRAWMRDATVPKRNIHFISADFNTSYEDKLLSELKRIKESKKSLILLEGVLFFINRSNTNRLFDFFERLQTTDEYVGSVSFTKAVESSKAFENLRHFTEERLEFNEKFDYQTVETSFYENLNGYKLLEHVDTLSLAQKFVPKQSLPKATVLNEHMYLLKKQS